jgi:hypothetical protein
MRATRSLTLGCVAEPALMLIDPWPWSAPFDDVRLKKN